MKKAVCIVSGLPQRIEPIVAESRLKENLARGIAEAALIQENEVLVFFSPDRLSSERGEGIYCEVKSYGQIHKALHAQFKMSLAGFFEEVTKMHRDDFIFDVS